MAAEEAQVQEVPGRLILTIRKIDRDMADAQPRWITDDTACGLWCQPIRDVKLTGATTRILMSQLGVLGAARP